MIKFTTGTDITAIQLVISENMAKYGKKYGKIPKKQ